MRIAYTFILSGLLAMAAFVLPAHIYAQDGPIFRTLQWQARVIVLTGAEEDPLLGEQIQIFKDNLADMQDRDITVIRFREDNLYPIEELSVSDYRGWYDMDAREQRYMEGRIQADNNAFAVVLIGKDGSFKNVWKDVSEAVPVSDIFAIIDAMPMREREAKEK